MRLAHGICAIAALLCLLCLGAGAVSVIEDHKHDYVSNETITFNVTNMTDGVNYSQKTIVYQYIKPGNGSEFGNNNITWPFAHKNDLFAMMNINTTYNSVVIGHWWPPAKGGYEEATWNGYSADVVTPEGMVVKNTWNESFNYEYDQTGTYTSHWKATPAPGATIVTSIFWINGTKISGPNDFTQNTSVWSKNPALVHVDWYENNTLTSQDWFTLDIDKAAIPTYVPGSSSGDSDSESYPGSGSGSGSASSGSGSGSDSGSGATTTKTTTTVAPSGTGDVTPSATETADVAEAATTTPAPAGSPFAFAALGALGVAGLLLAGRVRR